MIPCDKCPDRGSCCGPIPFSKEFIEKHKDKMQVEIKKESDDKLGKYLLTGDGACVFLDRKTRECVVYEDRPEICRRYGEEDNIRIMCPYFKRSGNPRSEASKKKIMRWHIHNLDNLVKGRKIIRRN